MEMTFYDDNMFRSSKGDTKSLKRPVTLDLDSSENLTKKQKFSSVLTSPDLSMLKLATPELERFIISNGNITTTPTPTQYLFNKNVTEEQEQYARGFIDALNQLHQHHAFDISSTNGLLSRKPPVASVTESSPSKLYGNILPFYMQSSQATTSVIKSSGAARHVPSASRPTSSEIHSHSSKLSDTCKSLDISKHLSAVRPASADGNSTSSKSSLDSSRHTTTIENHFDTFKHLVVRPPSADSNSTSSSIPLEINVKDDLQLVPSNLSTPPVSPIGKINMVDQERIKLERKRHRNRIAASKCRQRKLQKISQLEDKVKDLKGENNRLEMIVDKLREQVCVLKQQVLEHVKKGCQIMVTHSV